MKLFTRITPLLLVLCMAACGGSSTDNGSNASAKEASVKEPEYLYGINIEGYTIANDTVRSGETVGGILGRRGVSAVMVDRLDKAAADIFSLRKIRADKPYTTFTRTVSDSLGEREVLDWLVYHIDAIEYVAFGFHTDSVSVVKERTPWISYVSTARLSSTHRYGALSWDKICPTRWQQRSRIYTSGP